MVNNRRYMRAQEPMPTRQNGCGCGVGVGGEKLKKKLQMIDFALVEVNLYLDAYPNCSAALKYYHSLKAEREEVLAALSKANLPTSAFDVSDTERWNWIDSPWPWEFDAN